MFKRLRKSLTPHRNATVISHKGAIDSHDKANEVQYNDNLKPYMPWILVKEYQNFKKASHRVIQLRSNPDLFKLTYKYVNTLMKRRPYAFSYAKPYTREDIDATEEINQEGDQEDGSQGIKKAFGKDNKKSKSEPKRNAFPNQDPLQSPIENGGGVLFDPTENEGFKYEINTEMDYLYEEWNTEKYWKPFKEMLAKSFVNVAVIIKTVVEDKSHYWVFDRNHIVAAETEYRILKRICIRWNKIDSFIKETASGTAKELKERDVWYDVNVKDGECLVYIPWQSSDSVLGHSKLEPFWDVAQYKLANRFLQHAYLFNGGLISEVLRYPTSLASNIKANIEANSKRGIAKTPYLFEFPHGMNPEHIQNQFQYESTPSTTLNWQEANDLNSQDMQLPKSFIDGKNENEGGMGGSGTAKVSKSKEEEDLLLEFDFIEEAVKLSNYVFFGVEDEDYVVIPWQEEKKESPFDEFGNPTEANPLNADITPIDTPKGEKDVKDEKKDLPKKELKKNSIQPHFNSITEDNLYLYQGDILSIGALPQRDDIPIDHPDQEFQYIDEEAIRSFVEDPKSVKEYYHYSGPHKDEILKEEATAKIKIVGVNPETKGLMANIYFFKEPSQDELDLSPYYWSRPEKRADGKTYQVDLDIRNNIDTKNPRSMGKTKAFKQ